MDMAKHGGLHQTAALEKLIFLQVISATRSIAKLLCDLVTIKIFQVSTEVCSVSRSTCEFMPAAAYFYMYLYDCMSIIKYVSPCELPAWGWNSHFLVGNMFGV